MVVVLLLVVTLLPLQRGLIVTAGGIDDGAPSVPVNVAAGSATGAALLGVVLEADIPDCDPWPLGCAAVLVEGSVTGGGGSCFISVAFGASASGDNVCPMTGLHDVVVRVNCDKNSPPEMKRRRELHVALLLKRKLFRCCFSLFR